MKKNRDCANAFLYIFVYVCTYTYTQQIQEAPRDQYRYGGKRGAASRRVMCDRSCSD